MMKCDCCEIDCIELDEKTAKELEEQSEVVVICAACWSMLEKANFDDADNRQGGIGGDMSKDYRVSQRLNTERMEQVFGVQKKHDGKWTNCIMSGGIICFDTKQEAKDAIKEASTPFKD